MLQIKTEDGKKLEVTRAQFKEIDAVLDHAKKTFDFATDSCLITENLQGSCGVLITKF